MKLSVILCTFNPRPACLGRTLAGLRAQSLALDQWELLLVDNASTQPEARGAMDVCWHPHGRLITEPHLGLTVARRTGLTVARGEFVVLVDDDNVLEPTYLAEVLRIFAVHPRLGAAGGPSRPEFEMAPPSWAPGFFPLLALRDRGAAVQLVGLARSADGTHVLYPECAPIGAGMALRRTALDPWLATAENSVLTDRSGSVLTSGGDNDIVLTLLHAGWCVGYFPELALTHLIPANRLQPAYLARLNRGIQRSWMQVLSKHDANPWPPLTRTGARLRQAKAWFRCRAWRGPAENIRWQGACGHFEGRADK